MSSDEPDMPGTPTGTDVVRAGLYNLGAGAASKLLQFARAVVVARLLAPDEFGRFALVAVTVGVVEAVSQPGLYAAIVQAKSVGQRVVRTVWNVHVMRGVVLAAAVFVLAPTITSLLGAPETTDLLRAMSLVIAITSFRSMSLILRVRRVDFAPNARIQAAAEVVETIAAVVAVLVTRSAWGLVIGRLVALTIEVGASYLVPGFRPGLDFAWDELRGLLRFGRWMFASGLLTYASTNLDDLVVGRVAGTGPLGIYRVSYRFANTVPTELSHVAGRAAFPALARTYETARSGARAGFLRYLVLTAGLAAPAALVLAVLSDVLVRGLLGSAWTGAITPLAIMALGGFARAIVETGMPLFTGAGHPRLLTALNAARTVVLLALLVPLLLVMDVTGAALAYAAAEACTVPVWAYGLHRVGVAPRAAARATLPRLVPAGVAAAAAWVMTLLVPGPLAALATGLAAAGLAWILAVAVADRALRAEIISLWRMVRSLRGNRASAAGERQQRDEHAEN